jgi:serine/threonine protein kinase
MNKLGRGTSGVVYKIKEKNKYYALKISKIIDKDNKLYREINFYNNFAYKYPKYFVKLYSYYIDNKNIIYNHEDNLDFNLDPKEYDKIVQEYLLKHKSSKIYLYRIYDLVDFVLRDIIELLNKNELYSMLIQITNIINILHKNNYIHGDINIDNIGVLKTKNKYIKINNVNIPTFGYIYKLLDFDFVMHKNDITNEYEKNKFEDLLNNEYYNILNLFIKFYGSKGLHFNKFTLLKSWYFYGKITDQFYIDVKYDYLVQNNLIEINNKDDETKRYVKLYLYYLKNNDTLIPKSDIEYIINQKLNYNEIIEYLINKLVNKFQKSINFIYTVLI